MMAVMDRPATLNADAAYRALKTHDACFDGRLFVGVTSTGISCRPVCRVRMPRRENCRFFDNAASAECAGLRPCLRCRPELAPGLAATDSSQALARAGARLIEVDPPAAATPSSRPSTKVDPCIPSCTTP
jgi:AraC family transcriptional regulator of adaptative response / DNA-3-methyladenine glycosylase II